MIHKVRTLLPALILAAAASLSHAQEHISDVIYLKADGCAYTMDIFKPKVSNHAGIIFVVSGGWVSHHDMINPGVAQAYTDQGFTVFEVVHGSQPKYTMPEFVPQLHRAIRFIHANAAKYDIDPTRLGITGASAGGHLSLLLAGTSDQGNPNAPDPIDRQPDTVKAVVAFFPPTDFKNWGTTGTSAFHVPLLAIFMPAWGVTPSTPEETISKLDYLFAPIHWVTASYPPTLLVHGDADPLVPVQQSKLFDAELTDKGVDHKLVIVPGGKHDGGTFMAGMPAAIAWFTAHLK